MRRGIVTTLLCLALGACIQTPVFRDTSQARINSNYPITSLDGDAIERAYTLDFPAGRHSLSVVYDTLQYDYVCTFEWLAEAATVYEITDQENAYPLTLYRWQKRNGLWALRLDPVDPIECVQRPR